MISLIGRLPSPSPSFPVGNPPLSPLRSRFLDFITSNPNPQPPFLRKQKLTYYEVVPICGWVMRFYKSQKSPIDLHTVN